jgi:hypothetical protein
VAEQGCLLSSCPVYPGPRVRIPPSPPIFLARCARGIVPRIARYATVLLLVPALLTGCAGSSSEDREEDILAAVQIYLRQERVVNPDSMQMEVAELTLDGEQARAVVHFDSPDLGQSLRFVYLLERQEGTWKVLSSTSDGSPHGGGGTALPEGHPSVPEQPGQPDPNAAPPPSSAPVSG